MGVNSGNVVAGDSGYNDRREFAIVGNPAAVAARLEAASDDLGASIVASEVTYDAVRELFVGVPTSSLPLRGLRRLQNAYIIRGLTKRASDERLLTLPSQRSFNETVVHLYESNESQAVEPDPAPFTHFSRFDDEAPALPELPPVLGQYEDDQGPPVQLPP
jgi:hypothetical protein